MEFKEFLDALIKAVLTPSIPIIAGYLVSLLKKYTNKVQFEIQQQSLNKYIELAEEAIESAVLATTQTFVDELKKDGIFDVDRQKEALVLTKERASAIITQAAYEAIEVAYGDFDAWLDAKIHEIIRRDK